MIGGGLVAAGCVSMAAAVLADIGPWPYHGGAALVVVGICLLLSRVLRRPVVVVAACAAVAVVVGGSAWLGLHGIPEHHASWPDRSGGYGVTGDSGRQGDLWFTGGVAYEIATGEVRWTAWGDDEPPSTADDIQLVALTPTTVVSFEPSPGDESRGQLVARTLSDGTEQWSVPADESRGTAVDGDVLVATAASATTAYDLRTGRTLWSSPRESAPQCELGALRNSRGPAPEQAVVLLKSQERGAQIDAVRVNDGQVLTTDLSCLLQVRVAKDVIVQGDDDRVTGRSVENGKVLWRTGKQHRLPSPYNQSGSGSTVYTRTADDFSAGRETIPSYFGIDLATGAITESSPPAGWSVVRDETLRQTGEHVWQPVVRASGGLGMWELGTDRVVAVPGPQTYQDVATDRTSGWLLVTGRVADPVGDEHTRSWALSPDGDLHGPFTGRSAYVEDGLVQVDDRVLPLD